jgi:hypothetical protein
MASEVRGLFGAIRETKDERGSLPGWGWTTPRAFLGSVEVFCIRFQMAEMTFPYVTIALLVI